jgi:hypothetical protein
VKEEDLSLLPKGGLLKGDYSCYTNPWGATQLGGADSLD